MVGNDPDLKQPLLREYHFNATRGYLGAEVTKKRLNSYFYSKGLKEAVKKFVRECEICQRY